MYGRNQAWKLIPLRLLSGVGGTLLFQCKYDIKYLNLSADLLALNFYKDMISHRQELITSSQQQRKAYATKSFGKIDS